MHAMGYHHEHTRPDRDQYVTILFQNIEDRRRVGNFQKNANSETLGSPYDYGSVMHYPSWAFSIGNTNAIVPKIIKLLVSVKEHRT